MTFERAILLSLLINISIWLFAVIATLSYVLLDWDNSPMPSVSYAALYIFSSASNLLIAVQFLPLWGSRLLYGSFFDIGGYNNSPYFLTPLFPVTLLVWALVLAPLFYYFYGRYFKKN